MEGIELNIFQKLMTFYSEDTGYNVNVFLLFILAIALVFIYNLKFGSGNESYFDNLGYMIISIVLVFFFAKYVLDVKGLNEQRKQLLQEQTKHSAIKEKEYINSLYEKLSKNFKSSSNNLLKEEINKVAEYLLKNDSNAIEKLERLYDLENYRLSFLLMKTLKDGNSKIYKDSKKYEFYKELFLSEVCFNNNCDKNKLENLKEEDIDYLRNNSVIFDKKSRISFLEAIDFKCGAASVAYTISKDYGNKLAKKHECISLYNKYN